MTENEIQENNLYIIKYGRCFEVIKILNVYHNILMTSHYHWNDKKDI